MSKSMTHNMGLVIHLCLSNTLMHIHKYTWLLAKILTSGTRASTPQRMRPLSLREVTSPWECKGTSWVIPQSMTQELLSYVQSSFHNCCAFTSGRFGEDGILDDLHKPFLWVELSDFHLMANQQLGNTSDLGLTPIPHPHPYPYCPGGTWGFDFSL